MRNVCRTASVALVFACMAGLLPMAEAQISLYRPPGITLQPHSCPTLAQEMNAQQQIYHIPNPYIPQGYVIDRPLSYYERILPTPFGESIAALDATQRWLDIGAGQGRAILDYYTPEYDARRTKRERRGKKGVAVALSIEDRRTPAWHDIAAKQEPGQIRYLYNRKMQDYTTRELGQFKVISDVMGGFTYTADLTRFMERVLAVLEVKGSFYTVLQDINMESGLSRPFHSDNTFSTEIVNKDGSELKVCAWLKRISCVEVTCERKHELSPPSESYQVRKTCNQVRVPHLTPVHYWAGTPPDRRFLLDNAARGKNVASH